jgi:hypothetical protein
MRRHQMLVGAFQPIVSDRIQKERPFRVALVPPSSRAKNTLDARGGQHRHPDYIPGAFSSMSLSPFPSISFFVASSRGKLQVC